MTFRQQLRKTLKDKGPIRGRRWFVKTNSKNIIREIKMVFNPKDYAVANPDRKLYGDRKLLEILDKNYEKTNINN
jgi:hypothetical protein